MIQKIFVVFLFSSVFVTYFDQRAYSHPHTFMTQQITSVFDDKGLAGFKINWDFDEMFAAMIATDYDVNQNGSLEPDEVAHVRAEAFSYISEFNYFVFIRIDEKPFEVKFVKDFNAILSDGKLTYTFFIPCHVTAISNYKQIIVATYDPSYYSGIFFKKKDPAMLENTGRFDAKTLVQEDKATSIYYDMVNPWALFLDFRLK